MWTRTYHRFDTEAAFLAACVAAGLDPQRLPSDVALDVIGAIYGDAPEGEPPVLLPGWHVNAAWYQRALPAAFAAAQIHPQTPSRVWA